MNHMAGICSLLISTSLLNFLLFVEKFRFNAFFQIPKTALPALSKALSGQPCPFHVEFSAFARHQTRNLMAAFASFQFLIPNEL